jgi:hypothetical protein
MKFDIKGPHEKLLRYPDFQCHWTTVKHILHNSINEIIHCIPWNLPTSAYIWLYISCGPWPFFQFLNLYTVVRTPWMEDHPVARPLPTHRITQTQNKRTHICCALSGIRIHDPKVQAIEGSSCLRPRVHCDWRSSHIFCWNYVLDNFTNSHFIILIFKWV